MPKTSSCFAKLEAGEDQAVNRGSVTWRKLPSGANERTEMEEE